MPHQARFDSTCQALRSSDRLSFLCFVADQDLAIFAGALEIKIHVERILEMIGLDVHPASEAEDQGFDHSKRSAQPNDDESAGTGSEGN